MSLQQSLFGTLQKLDTVTMGLLQGENVIFSTQKLDFGTEPDELVVVDI